MTPRLQSPRRAGLHPDPGPGVPLPLRDLHRRHPRPRLDEHAAHGHHSGPGRAAAGRRRRPGVGHPAGPHAGLRVRQRRRPAARSSPAPWTSTAVRSPSRARPSPAPSHPRPREQWAVDHDHRPDHHRRLAAPRSPAATSGPAGRRSPRRRPSSRPKPTSSGAWPICAGFALTGLTVGQPDVAVVQHAGGAGRAPRPAHRGSAATPCGARPTCGGNAVADLAPGDVHRVLAARPMALGLHGERRLLLRGRHPERRTPASSSAARRRPGRARSSTPGAPPSTTQRPAPASQATGAGVTIILGGTSSIRVSGSSTPRSSSTRRVPATARRARPASPSSPSPASGDELQAVDRRRSGVAAPPRRDPAAGRPSTASSTPATPR